MARTVTVTVAADQKPATLFAASRRDFRSARRASARRISD